MKTVLYIDNRMKIFEVKKSMALITFTNTNKHTLVTHSFQLQNFQM
jgi:hypothetical protein